MLFRSIDVGQSLLHTQPNLWLQAMAENALMATCILVSDYESGLRHGSEALRHSRESGAAAMTRAALSNLGMLHYLVGDFDRAVSLLDEADDVMPATSERANARLDSLARVRMAIGDLGGAVECLNTISRNVRRRDRQSTRLNSSH